MVRLYLLGKKGLSCIKGLNPKYHQLISEVVIGRDSGVLNDYSSELEALCGKLGISTCFKYKESTEADLKIAVGWRWLIEDFENLLVFHDSLLPKYRGFNPLVTALINGDKEIGASVILANQSFDRGDILMQKSISISYPIKIEMAIDEMSRLYSSMLNTLLEQYQGASNLEAEPQDESLATYSLWRDEDDYVIDWKQSSHEIVRFVDAVGYPYKGAKTKYDGQWIRIFDAESVDDITISNRTPGKVIWRTSNGLVVVCGKGLLKVNAFYDDMGEPLDFNKKLRIKFSS